MHDKLGKLDYVHIPLFIMEEHFPEEFHLIQQYWSFAVIRDPFSRFASSVSQRLKMYGKPIQALSENEIRQEVWDCIDFLKKNENEQALLPFDYIHFQRQIDYIALRGRKIVDDIYTTDQLDILINDLLKKLGYESKNPNNKNMKPSIKNNTFVYRNDFVRLIINAIKPFRRFLAASLPGTIKETIKRKIYVIRDEKIGQIFSEPPIKSFIYSYYKLDIDLYREVKQRK